MFIARHTKLEIRYILLFQDIIKLLNANIDKYRPLSVSSRYQELSTRKKKTLKMLEDLDHMSLFILFTVIFG